LGINLSVDEFLEMRRQDKELEDRLDRLDQWLIFLMLALCLLCLTKKLNLPKKTGLCLYSGYNCILPSIYFRPYIIAAWPCICPYAPIPGKILCTQVAGERGITTKISWSDRAFKFYVGKAGAAVKSIIRNALNAVSYGYAGKAGTIFKSTTPNTGNAVRYGYAGKAGAIVKSVRPNAGNAGGYGYAGKAFATVKSARSNAGNAVSYGYAGKFGAA
jgi:hypothetical protein